MIARLVNRIKLYRQLCFFKYLYLNYFCKQVIRTDNSHIIPYKGSVIDLEKNARIYLGGGDLEIGCDHLRGSKAETRIRLRENAVWSSEGGCRVAYGSTVELLHDALLDSRFFTLNCSSTVVAAKKIQLGQDVMAGRNVVIYDSDFHTILNTQHELMNPDAPVTVGDHVWLATNVTVLKGSSIGPGSIIAANSVVHETVPSGVIYQSGKFRQNYGEWRREHPQEQEQK